MFTNISRRVVVWILINISPSIFFSQNTFVGKIFQKSSGLFLAGLSVNELSDVRGVVKAM